MTYGQKHCYPEPIFNFDIRITADNATFNATFWRILRAIKKKVWMGGPSRRVQMSVIS